MSCRKHIQVYEIIKRTNRHETKIKIGNENKQAKQTKEIKYVYEQEINKYLYEIGIK